MPAKKGNVLTQLLCVLKVKKTPCEDIVTLADNVVRDYIYSKNKYIRHKYRKSNQTLCILSSLLITSLVLAAVIIKLI